MMHVREIDREMRGASGGHAGWVLVAIVSVAAIMRFWGIWYADSGDEINEVFEALRVGSGQLNYERWFKRFYLYILAVEYGAYFAIGWIAGFFDSPTDFAVKIVRDMDPLFLIARATSAIAGTLSVFMAYKIGRVLYDRRTGLVAALFLCFNAVNIELSHYARVDATLCAVVLVAFYWIVCIMKFGSEHRLRYYALAGFFMGIAVQNKFPAAILVFPFLFAHLATLEFRISLHGLFGSVILTAAVCFVGGLVVGNPAVLFAPLKFVQGFYSMGDSFTTAINETRSEQIGYVLYLKYFLRELGVPLAIVAVYSVWRALLGKKREDILILSFIVPFFGVMGASRYMVSDSYMIPLMPFLYLLCARHLLHALEGFKSLPSTKSYLAGAALLFLFAYPVAMAGMMVLSFAGPNTRHIAKAWIESNIPPGSKLLMDSGKTINSTAPLIAENADSIHRSISELEDKLATGTLRDPTKMVDRNAIRYFEMRLKTVPEIAYDITSTKFGLEVESVEHYKKRGYQYFVISREMKTNRTGSYAHEAYPRVAEFYSSLDADSRLELVKVIEPTAMNRGDSYLIYRVL